MGEFFMESDPADLFSKLSRMQTANSSEKILLLKSIDKLPDEKFFTPLLSLADESDFILNDWIAEVIARNERLFFEHIVNALSNPKSYIRWIAVTAIDKCHKRRYIPALIPAIGEGYEPVVSLICKTLRRLDPERFKSRSLESILSALTRKEKLGILMRIVKLLGENAPDLIETNYALDIISKLRIQDSLLVLMKVSFHPDWRIKQRALSIVKDQCDPVSFLSICNGYFDHKIFYETRLNFKLPGEEYHAFSYYLLKILPNHFTDIYFKEFESFLYKLIDTGNPIEKILTFKNLIIISMRSGKLKENRMDGELKRLYNRIIGELPEEYKGELIRHLGELGIDWLVNSLLAFSEDARSEIRLAILNALLKNPLKTERLDEKLGIMLVDYDRAVRRAALDLFWKLRPRLFGKNEGDIIKTFSPPIRDKLLDMLTQRLRTGTDEYIKFAAFWLSVLHYKPALKYLIEFLDHPSPDVQIGIIIALGLYGDPSTIPHLLDMLDVSDGRIQEKIIQTLGSLGMDGIHALVGKLFRKNRSGVYTHPEVLEKYLRSFGGKIIKFLEREAETEKDTVRKTYLKALISDLENNYSIESNNDFKIFL